jgi:hypothetical protein
LDVFTTVTELRLPETHSGSCLNKVHFFDDRKRNRWSR